LQGGKILASGTDTAADGMIKLAGAVNAIDGFTGYKQLTDEAVISAKPDAILLMQRAGQSMTDEQVLQHPAIGSTPAGEAKNIIRMDGAYLLGFGPRTANAIRDLASGLYGDTVGK
jgi:iron complex transport system substrate-binding protein